MALYKTLDDGSVGQTIVRDYQHGRKIFIDSQYRLSPKYGFLFYVEFDFNPLITNVSNQAAQELGMVVKSCTLPKFNIETKVHNAYNRVNIVQNKIKYDPVSITFHDDQSDNVRNFWYDYYSFFFRDPDYADATYQATHKYQSRPSFDWGYSPRPTVGYNNANGVEPYQYIQAIRIYSLYQGQFSEYQLVNPVIQSFKHSDHANGENTALMSHEMTVQYETVKYLTGTVTENTVGGFIDLHYDRSPSPLGSNLSTDDTIIDLANNTTAINPALRIDSAIAATSLSGALSASSLLSGATSAASLTPINSGGFSIPSLGSLTQGVTNSAMLGQQLNAAGIGIVGGAASQVAGAITGGIAAGLGANGQNILALGAAAISNPSAALKTVENMAIQYATGIVAGSITSLLTPLTNNLQQGLTSAIQNNITTPISNAWGEGQLWVSQQTYSMIDAGTIPQQYMSDPALQMLQNSDNGNMAAPLTIDNSVPYTPE